MLILSRKGFQVLFGFCSIVFLFCFFSLEKGFFGEGFYCLGFLWRRVLLVGFLAKGFDIGLYDFLHSSSSNDTRGAAPVTVQWTVTPTKGVPPFGTLLRALRGRESAVNGKNNFRIRSSREQALDKFAFSPFLRVRASRRKHLTL